MLGPTEANYNRKSETQPGLVKGSTYNTRPLFIDPLAGRFCSLNQYHNCFSYLNNMTMILELCRRKLRIFHLSNTLFISGYNLHPIKLPLQCELILCVARRIEPLDGDMSLHSISYLLIQLRLLTNPLKCFTAIKRTRRLMHLNNKFDFILHFLTSPRSDITLAIIGCIHECTLCQKNKNLLKGFLCDAVKNVRI